MSKVLLMKWDCQPRPDDHIWNSKDKIVYGPVCSRRYRYSLGVNFFPRIKICDLNCVYCDMGSSQSQVLREKALFQQAMVPSKEMLYQIRKAFEYHCEQGTEIDYITICGNGEAPLHPEFAEVVDGLISLRNELLPEKPLAILTDSSIVITDKQEEVLSAIMRLDERVFKLDAGDQRTFLKINRPLIRMNIRDIISQLNQLNNIKISTAIVDAPNYSNIPSLQSSYTQVIKKMKPLEIHLHNIDYPIPSDNDQNIRRLTIEEMMELGGFISNQAGILVKVLHSPISFRESICQNSVIT